MRLGSLEAQNKSLLPMMAHRRPQLFAGCAGLGENTTYLWSKGNPLAGFTTSGRFNSYGDRIYGSESWLRYISSLKCNFVLSLVSCRRLLQPTFEDYVSRAGRQLEHGRKAISYDEDVCKQTFLSGSHLQRSCGDTQHGPLQASDTNHRTE